MAEREELAPVPAIAWQIGSGASLAPWLFNC